MITGVFSQTVNEVTMQLASQKEFNIIVAIRNIYECEIYINMVNIPNLEVDTLVALERQISHIKDNGALLIAQMIDKIVMVEINYKNTLQLGHWTSNNLKCPKIFHWLKVLMQKV